MRILLGLAILVTLALLAASKRLWTWRRTPAGAALMTGGWIMVALGMLVGPHGVGLVLPQQLMTVQPLILFCLGWVGLMVGLQLDRRLPSMLPTGMFRLTLMEAGLSFAGIGGAAVAVLLAFGEPWRVALPVALLLGACGVGWSAEVRSLRPREPGATRIAAVMRIVAGLGSILAVVAFGLLIKSLVPAPGAAVDSVSAQIALGLAVAVVIGGGMGLMGHWLMLLVRRGGGEFLAVLIGLVALTAGAAAVLGYSPLFVALLTGAVLVNVRDRTLQTFKRGVVNAEQPMAMAVMLVAGVLADPRIGWDGLAVVGVVAGARGLIKLGPSRWLVRRSLHEPGEPRRPTPTLLGLLRQSPLAIALALGYTVAVHGRDEAAPISGPELLMIVILVGLVTELWPYLPRRSARKAEAGRDDRPTAVPAGEGQA